MKTKPSILGMIQVDARIRNSLDILHRIKSVLDGKAMDGISSLRIHSGPDMTQDRLSEINVCMDYINIFFFRCLIRWTEVFLINTGDKGTPTHGEKQ